MFKASSSLNTCVKPPSLAVSLPLLFLGFPPLMYSKRALLSTGNSQLYLPKVCRYSRVSSGLIKSLDKFLRHIRTASERFEFPAANEYTADKPSDYGRNINGFEGRGWNSAMFHRNQNEQRGAYGERGGGIQNRNHGETAQMIYERTTIQKNGGGSDNHNNGFSQQNPSTVNTHMQNQTWGHNHSGHGQTRQFPSSFNQQAQSQYPGNPNWNETQNMAQTWGNGNVGNAETNPWNWQNPNIGQHQPNSTYQHGMMTSQATTTPESQADFAQASENEMPEPQDRITVEEMDRFCKEGKLKEAVELLGQLINKGSVVDLPRLLQLVQLCGEEEALQEAKSVHEHIVASVPHIEITTYNNIIEMYSKCGSMDDASSVFEKMSERNLETWDLMIRWLAKNGSGEEAIDMFTRFKQEGNKPNGQIYTGVFSACGVLGDVTEGMLHFKVMCEEYGIVPSMEHYLGLVEMFAIGGYLDEAWEFIERMPMEPSVEVWETLMNLSRSHGNLEIGDRCCEMIEILDPSRLNEQTKNGFLPIKTVDFAKEKQKKMLIGQNPLEIRSRVHEYRAGDTSHPENKRIYAMLRCLKAHMVEMGYIPETRFVLHDVDHESKEEALLSHSERLAFAHGLLTTSARSSIRVIKNLRVCVDCHNALKIISKIVGREFIMRDAKRFHHLKDGVCSCRDYW